MAMVDRTRELEPLAAEASRPIGWERRSAQEMLTESERLFAETGRYCGVADLELKRGDPIRFEKIFSPLPGGILPARAAAAQHPA